MDYSTTARGTPFLRLPLQAAPVERTLSSGAPMAARGVEAAFSDPFDDPCLGVPEEVRHLCYLGGPWDGSTFDWEG
jgi:hypothetical protein